MGNQASGLFIFGTVPTGTQLGFILLTVGHIESVTSSDSGVYIIRVHEDANNNNKVSVKVIALDGAKDNVKVWLKNGRILAITRFSMWQTVSFISTISFTESISRQDGTDGFEVVEE